MLVIIVIRRFDHVRDLFYLTLSSISARAEAKADRAGSGVCLIVRNQCRRWQNKPGCAAAGLGSGGWDWRTWALTLLIMNSRVAIGVEWPSWRRRACWARIFTAKSCNKSALEPWRWVVPSLRCSWRKFEICMILTFTFRMYKCQVWICGAKDHIWLPIRWQ